MKIGNDLSAGLAPSSAVKTISAAVKIINTYRFTTATSIRFLVSGNILYNFNDSNINNFHSVQIYHPDCSSVSNSNIILTSYKKDNDGDPILYNYIKDDELASIHFHFGSNVADALSKSQHTLINLIGIKIILQNIIIKFSQDSYLDIKYDIPRIIFLRLDNSTVNFYYNIHLSSIPYIGVRARLASTLSIGTLTQKDNQISANTFYFDRYQGHLRSNFSSLAIEVEDSSKIQFVTGKISIIDFTVGFYGSSFAKYQNIYWGTYYNTNSYYYIGQKKIQFKVTNIQAYKKEKKEGEEETIYLYVYLFKVSNYTQFIAVYPKSWSTTAKESIVFAKNDIETNVNNNIGKIIYLYNNYLRDGSSDKSVPTSSKMLEKNDTLLLSSTYITQISPIVNVAGYPIFRYANIDQDNKSLDPDYYGCVII